MTTANPTVVQSIITAVFTAPRLRGLQLHEIVVDGDRAVGELGHHSAIGTTAR